MTGTDILEALAQNQETQTRPSFTNGSFAIAVERARQVTQEGYSVEHDDAHKMAELTQAAIAYAIYTYWLTDPVCGWTEDQVLEIILEQWWPWDERDWKPSQDPSTNLKKAGALIAADLDRLGRIPKPNPPKPPNVGKGP